MTRPERCLRCNRAADPSTGEALAWVCDRRPDGGRDWTCPACARDHLRSIESRLPDEWW
ncbi:MAG TPA: hypothetical protein VGH99_11410 [Pseudonocardia sp.]|jgi:hypothetical protein